jgi:hypothetical protein
VVISDNQADENKGDQHRNSGDELKGNQFVWIPVDDVSDYKKQYNVGTNHSNTTDDTLPAGVVSELEQITKYGGFYVARYGAGIPEGSSLNNTASTAVRNVTGITPVSKQNMTPWNYINYNNAKINAESMYTGANVKSGLVTGTQWDVLSKFIESEPKNVQTDSRVWGNYWNSAVTPITELSTNNGASWTSATATTINTSQLLKTGHSSYTKARNMYDIAGNLYEWTNEITGTNRVIRGGVFNYNGDYSPGACRGGSTGTGSSDYIGFRVVLYLN